jgi:hypothetical protein
VKPDRATIRRLKRCAVGIALVLAACSTMSELERKVFLCEEWERGTKNVDQLKASYFIVTGKRLIIRSGGPRTGVSFIEGDLNQLAQEVDAACEVLSTGSE